MIKQMFAPLFALKGNARYAVFTEPLWGIPFHLYFPFLTLFMFSLGVSDANIGILFAVGLIVQMVASVLSGVLTDKFGRRKTNIIWDHLAWTVPCLIWAFAQDFRWFIVAALFHGLWPIGSNAWECLLVEDEKPDKIVRLFNWVYIMGSVSIFFAPISIFFIRMFDLVPVMRVLLVFAAISMSAKFILHYIFATEPEQGIIRMRETVGVSIYKLLWQYTGVLKQIFTTPATRRVLILIIVVHIQHLATNFFALYITQDLGIPEEYMAWFPVLRGIIMLTFFLVFQRILDRYPIYMVMIVGLGFYMGGYILLLLTPAGFLFPLLIFTAIDACATALFMPRRDTLVINNVDPAERARIRAMLMAIMLGVASPFAAMTGQLSEINRRIPLMASLGLFVIIGFIVMMERRKTDETNKPATA
ncbi:MAG: MFS transporter [Firmicutes bacterium]|nr:MFS transporter [Bacillota bacterium]